MYLKLKNHRYWHPQDHKVGYEGTEGWGIPHFWSINAVVAIERFDQRGYWVACEEIAEEERHRPYGDDHKHSMRPDSEFFDRKDVHIEYHDWRLSRAQGNYCKNIDSKFALVTLISMTHVSIDPKTTFS